MAIQKKRGQLSCKRIVPKVLTAHKCPGSAQSRKFSTNLAESFVECIARAAHGADGILFRLLRQCLAQPADMNVDSALVDFRRQSPNGVEQLRARKDPARFPHQMVEQAELGWPHMQLTAGAAGPPVLPVEIEITRRKHAAGALRAR